MTEPEECGYLTAEEAFAKFKVKHRTYHTANETKTLAETFSNNMSLNEWQKFAVYVETHLLTQSIAARIAAETPWAIRQSREQTP
jgi:hypothetical protein